MPKTNSINIIIIIIFISGSSRMSRRCLLLFVFVFMYSCVIFNWLCVLSLPVKKFSFIELKKQLIT